MRRFATVAIVLSVGAALTACGTSPNEHNAAASPSPAKSVEASIRTAALAQKSVHWAETADSTGQSPSRWVSDVNGDSGTQRLTVTGGQFPGKVDLRLVNGVVYVRGDSGGLQYLLSLTPAQAKRYAEHWISIPKGNSLHGQLADGLTLSSIIHDVVPQVSLGVRRTSHAALSWNDLDEPPRAATSSRKLRQTPHSGYVVLWGSTPDSGALPVVSAHATGEPLPIAFVVDVDPEDGFIGRFSKWNELVRVHAPTSATPLATVLHYRSSSGGNTYLGPTGAHG